MRSMLSRQDDIKLRDALAVLTGISQTSVVLGCANISDVTEIDGSIDKIFYGFSISIDRCINDIRDIITRNNIADIS
ncbi:hypothetical protein [Campylobacter hyointestinalis]|uniref:hypothetical protein n=1 Tax=Campylobacter hyointestinalis TaxID=198 RepID=UPI000DCCD151|nr:hypothetical protein [Campylobacter hyointestinalis]RAZ58727.1 hypothetical protein CHL10071_09645 [Campylobacter hyointestinalis subsp. lawsonii]